MVSYTSVRLHDLTTIFCPISFVPNRALVENCTHKLGVESSNPTKTFSFYIENWFFENVHRGPYFEGFQTKWIMTSYGTCFNPVIVLFMSF